MANNEFRQDHRNVKTTTKSELRQKNNKCKDQITPNSMKTGNHRRPFHALYAEVCALDDIDEIKLFKIRNCNVSTSIELNSSRIRPSNCGSDFGAGPNLPRDDKIEPGWMNSILVSKEPLLQIATNQKVGVADTIILYLRMGQNQSTVGRRERKEHSHLRPRWRTFHR